ncbi:hypothetical protein [Apibacter sp. HY039]|uniref:hypothetical protein n=1 Tax=Apibacter sp. HY039 TaxID=2501476 RepID=UPI000FEC01AE|nr:hypothetical protein [Apibacter sp. HY039]
MLLKKSFIILGIQVLIIALNFISCGANKVPVDNFKYSYCTSANSYHQDNFLMDTLQVDANYKDLYSSSLSQYDISMGKVLGINKEINNLIKLRNDPVNDNRLDILELKQIITQRISLAKTELDAIISELDCEGERADLAAAYLDDLNDGRNTRLTVGSVVIGALTTVATVLFKDSNTQTAVGVGGGLLSAGLGALTIKPKGKKIEFYHSKNILSPIWANENHEEYPNLVWNIFQIIEFNSEEHMSLQESTKKRWKKFVLKGDIDSTEENLFFGTGGNYTADELHMRSEMIDQIKSSTRYINQLLSVFESDLYKVYKQ